MLINGGLSARGLDGDLPPRAAKGLDGDLPPKDAKGLDGDLPPRAAKGFEGEGSFGLLTRDIFRSASYLSLISASF